MKNCFKLIINILVLIIGLDFIALSQNYPLKIDNIRQLNLKDAKIIYTTSDQSGYFYLAGTFQVKIINFGSFTLNNNNPGKDGIDFFIIKLDQKGDILLASNGKNGVYGELFSIFVDNTSKVYITGNFKKQSGTLKNIIEIIIDYNGDQTIIEGPSSNRYKTYGIVADNKQNSYIYGYCYDDSITFGNKTIKRLTDSALIFIVKYSDLHEVAWVIKCPLKSIYPTNIPPRLDINYILIDDNANLIINDYFDVDTIYFGNIVLTSNKNTSRFLAKFDSSGKSIWAKSYGRYPIFGISFSLDINNNIYLGGNFCDSFVYFDSLILRKEKSLKNQYYIFKIDKNGNVIWGKSSNSDGHCSIENSIIGKDGKYYYIGYSEADSLFIEPNIKRKMDTNPSVFISSLNEDGLPQYFSSLNNIDSNISKTYPSWKFLSADNDFFYFLNSMYIYDSLQNKSVPGYCLIKISQLTSIDDKKPERKFTIYPNPSADFIKLRYLKNNNNSFITLSDITGKLIRTEILASDNVIIDISLLPVGLYIIQINDGNDILAKRFIKN